RIVSCFFFQAEDGIRDRTVTGVQTCALPILERVRGGEMLRMTLGEDRWQLVERMQAVMSLIEGHAEHTMDAVGSDVLPSLPRLRSEERRVGKEGRSSW